MKKLIFILLATIWCIGANGQRFNVYESDIDVHNRIFQKCDNINCNEWMLIVFKKSENELQWDFYYPVIRKDTVDNKIILKVMLGYDWNGNILITKTGTKEEIEQWALNPFKEKNSGKYYNTDIDSIVFQNSHCWNFYRINDTGEYNSMFCEEMSECKTDVSRRNAKLD